MIPQLTDKQKINAVRILALLSTLVMMLYAPKLWITTKDFPVVPLFNWLPIPTYPFDYILASIYAISMLVYLFKPKRILGIFIVILYIYLALVDQNRLQPYFYQSMLTILIIVLFNKDTYPKKIVYTLMLVFLATYFWSGVQKINILFYNEWMHALLKHFSFIPEILLQTFTYLVPWLEAIMAVFLLFNKTRKLGILMIVLMHSIIVIMLLYLGYGFNVIPWNLQNIVSVIILFWYLKTDTPLEIFTYYFNKQKLLILFMTFVLPFSNIYGYWDNLLSFSFFSSKLNYYYIALDDDLADRLPNHIQKYYRVVNGQSVLYMNEWAGDVNKVLFYPEERIIYYMDNYIRSFDDNPKKEELTKLVVYNK